MSKIKIKKGMSEEEVNQLVDYALEQMTLKEKIGSIDAVV